MGGGRGGTGLVILTMTLVLLIDSLDASIVQVALPEMSLDLGMSVTDGAFVVVAYIFPLAGLCIPLSRLASDGRVRTMLVLGTVVFTVASVGCAMSGDRGVLIAFRFMQGLGAAMMVSVTPTMCTSMLPPERRHMGMAYMNAACCVAIILGPALGGLITGLSEWHWFFLINVPVGVIVVALALRIREEPPRGMAGIPEPARAAAMFAAVATGMVVLEMWTGGLFAWYTFILAAVCVLSSAVFVVLGRRGSEGERLIDIPLRGHRPYYVSAALFLVVSAIGCGAMYLLPYYLTGSAGYGTLAAGLLLSVSTTVSAIVSIPAGRWCRRYGCRLTSNVSLVMRVAFCAMLVVIGPSMGLAFLLVQLVLMGASFGIAGTALPTRMQAHVPEDLRPSSAAVVLFMNYISSALGVAVFALFFKAVSPGGMASAIDVTDGMAIMDGTHFACLIGMLMSVVCLFVSMRLRDPDERKNDRWSVFDAGEHPG